MSRPSREINGPRPSQLKIHKNSHQIQKPISAATVAATGHQQRGPVIIYTQSPKIIHTHARDFMALVQKLTGQCDDNNLKSEPMPIAPSPEIDAGGTDKNAEGAHEAGEVIDAELELDHMFPDMSLSSEFFCSQMNAYREGSISSSFVEF